MGYRFKASLGYVVCLCPKQKKKRTILRVCVGQRGHVLNTSKVLGLLPELSNPNQKNRKPTE